MIMKRIKYFYLVPDEFAIFCDVGGAGEARLPDEGLQPLLPSLAPFWAMSKKFQKGITQNVRINCLFNDKN